MIVLIGSEGGLDPRKSIRALRYGLSYLKFFTTIIVLFTERKDFLPNSASLTVR